MSYVPQPGTIPARAIALLREQRTPLSTEMLGEQLGYDSTNLTTCLRPAVEHGLLVRDQRSPRRSYWSIGSGKAMPAQPDDDPPVHRVVSANGAPGLNWKPPAQPVFVGPCAEPGEIEILHVRAGPATNGDACNGAPVRAPAAVAPPPTSAPTSAATAASPPRAEPAPARFALWSDGTLEIRRDTELVSLTTDETKALLKYLDRLVAEEGA